MNMPLMPHAGAMASQAYAQAIYPLTYGAFQYAGAVSEIGQAVQTRLSNGVTSYFQEVPYQQKSCLTVMLPASSELCGIRELLPELLIKGSQSTKAFLTQLNADLDVQLVGDKLQLKISSPVGNEANMVQTALQLLINPQVDNEHFIRSKEDLIKQIQNSRSLPEVPLGEAMSKALYGSRHPYAKSLQETSNAISLQTLNSVMATWKNILQFPEQVVISMTSPQPAAYQQALIDDAVRRFGWYANPYRNSNLPITQPVNSRRGIEGPILVPNETLPQAYIMSAWHAIPANDPDYPAFCVLRELLEGSSGAFFKILRTEKGLVYGSQQSYYGDQKAGTSYNVTAQVDFNKIKEGLDGIQKVTEKFIKSYADEADLSSAKKKFVLKMRTAMQTSEGIASISDTLLSNDLPPVHPDALKSAIDKVTSVDICRVANRIFNTSQGFQVVGISAPKNILMQFAKEQASLISPKKAYGL